LVAAALAVVVAGSGGCSGDGGDGRADASVSGASGSVPADVPAPDRTSAQADLDFLDAEGSMVLVVHRTAISMASGTSAAKDCKATASGLDDTAPSEPLLARIAALNDDVLRTALHSERLALGRFLTSCISGTAVGTTELRSAADVVTGRLAEIEKAR
jgi:hypothetical protein